MKETNTNDESSTRSKVLIIDDHPLVRDAVSRAINRESDLVTCGEAGNSDEAIDAIEKLEPDMILLDLSLPGMSGFDLLQEIKSAYPELPVLVLSMHSESTHAARVLRAGAQGYIMKREKAEMIIKAIRHVLSGRIWVNKEVMPEVVEAHAGDLAKKGDISQLLSKRELEIFELIGKGNSTKQIAEKFYISQRTVESHRDHIKTKIGAEDVFHLHQLAFQWVQNNILP